MLNSLGGQKRTAYNRGKKHATIGQRLGARHHYVTTSWDDIELENRDDLSAFVNLQLGLTQPCKPLTDQLELC